MRWRSAWLTASSLAVLLAACGGRAGPSLPAGYANLAEVQADRIETLLDAGQPCPAVAPAHRLQADTIDAINRRTVPEQLQEDLLSRVNGLATRVGCPTAAPETAAASEVARSLASWLRAHD